MRNSTFQPLLWAKSRKEFPPPARPAFHEHYWDICALCPKSGPPALSLARTADFVRLGFPLEIRTELLCSCRLRNPFCHLLRPLLKRVTSRPNVPYKVRCFETVAKADEIESRFAPDPHRLGGKSNSRDPRLLTDGLAVTLGDRQNRASNPICSDICQGKPYPFACCRTPEIQYLSE